jgi:hypothetical protein
MQDHGRNEMIAIRHRCFLLHEFGFSLCRRAKRTKARLRFERKRAWRESLAARWRYQRLRRLYRLG